MVRREQNNGPGRLALIAAALAVSAAAVAAPRGRGPVPQDIPGPLSAAHVPKPGESDCAACHETGGAVAPAKCLACHTEIASRIAAQKGYHRDKAAACALCHAEHQGRQASLVPLDKAAFDHAETGAELRGAHLRAKDCDVCHTASNSYPRSKGRSYLFKAAGCRACHASPHPGGQDLCLSCHSETSWVVERRAEWD